MTTDATPTGQSREVFDERRSRTRSIRNLGLVTAFVAAGLFASLGLASSTEADGGHDHAAEVAVELLSPRSTFTDDVATQIRSKFERRGTDVSNLRDASTIATARVTIPPGAVFPWHTHPGPVLLNIESGEFVYRLAADCVDRHYDAGEALVDAGGPNVHTAYNPATGDDAVDTVVIATFLGAPADGPMTIPVEGPDPDTCPLPTP